MRNDENFLSDIAKGMMPRRFQADHPNDRIIYEEDQEVAEMYFVQSGFIGIAVNQYGCITSQSNNFEIGRRQQGN